MDGSISVSNRELLIHPPRPLQLIHQRHSVVFCGNAALAVRVRQQFLSAQPELPRPHARLNHPRRTEVTPLKPRSLQQRQNIPVRPRNPQPFLRKLYCIHQLNSRRHLQASRAAHHNQPLHSSAPQSLHQRRNRAHNRIGILPWRGNRTHCRIGAVSCRRHTLRLVHVGLYHRNPGLFGNPFRIPRRRRHRVPSAHQLLHHPAANHAGSSKHHNVHSLFSCREG
jgi:hypothetical protein